MQGLRLNRAVVEAVAVLVIAALLAVMPGSGAEFHAQDEVGTTGMGVVSRIIEGAGPADQLTVGADEAVEITFSNTDTDTGLPRACDATAGLAEFADALGFWEAEIECMAGYGITAGFPDGTYRPGVSVSRQQMALFIARMAAQASDGDLEIPTFDDDAFDDIAGINPPEARDAINWLAELGITTGVTPDRFVPGARLTRQQMASFIARAHVALGVELPAPSSPAVFTDTALIAGVHRDNVLTLHAAGVVQGRVDGTYEPGALVTRGQMSGFIVRSIGVLDLQGLWNGRLAVRLPNGEGPIIIEKELARYASDTWRSLDAMVLSQTGLPADSIRTDGLRAGQTSPTNIGVYLWSALAARDLGLITTDEARTRLATTVSTLAEMERHAPSGQFFNWYDPATGEVLDVWPDDGARIYPFLSAVDNGWLSAALLMVANAVPEVRAQALALHESMDFGFYYDRQVGLLRGGYWPVVPPRQRYAPTISAEPVDSPAGGDPGGGYTDYHNGTLNSETRIAGYLAMVAGHAPPEHYFRMRRTFPAGVGCEWAWQEMRPVGDWTSYLGVEVFAGAYTYRGMQIVPSWGGSMFEALMVNLIVPEARWGPDSWGVNHPLYVQAHVEHGLEEAGYGYWGFSPARIPEGGYLEYGVEAIGLDPDGYPSNNDRTNVDYGYEGCRDPQPLPEQWPNGVVTPHAALLALEFAPKESLENLAQLRHDFPGIYTAWGFRDSVNVQTGTISDHYLALDQGMIMAAIANATLGETFRDYFVQGAIEQALRPLLELEEFNAAPAR
jgi:hypothetical protein